MKKLLSIITLALFLGGLGGFAQAQTLHSIIMVNKEEPNRQVDRTAEMNNMSAFVRNIANLLGYKNNMRCRSGQQFTGAQLDQDIAALNVTQGDVVIFYYSGHGLNYDDDEWPHMALKDCRYHETTVYNKLLQRCAEAKLILCISACCNMDSEGLNRQKKSYANPDPTLTKRLFRDFEGHRAYVASSSIRGQYSYSWAGGPTPGAIYGIALREAIQEAMSGAITAEWDYVFEAAKQKTLQKTEQKQMPQFSKKRW